VIFAEHLSKIF